MKKNIIKILLTIISLVILFFVIRFLDNYHKLEDSGTIQVIVIDENDNTVIDEEVSYTKGQSLKELFEANFDIEERNGFLVRINDVYADGKEYFLKIYLNNKPALYGINQLKYKNGDVIMIVHTKVGDYRDPH